MPLACFPHDWTYDTFYVRGEHVQVCLSCGATRLALLENQHEQNQGGVDERSSPSHLLTGDVQAEQDSHRKDVADH